MKVGRKLRQIVMDRIIAEVPEFEGRVYDDATKGDPYPYATMGPSYWNDSSVACITRDKSLGDQDAFYARWVEFGTKNMPASPFFFVVWRLHRRRVRNGINRAARKAVKSL